MIISCLTGTHIPFCTLDHDDLHLHVISRIYLILIDTLLSWISGPVADFAVGVESSRGL